jgi:hypothetical protein
MDPSAYDPQDHARSLYQENLWLRELRTKVAQDLEHVACLDEYNHHSGRLLSRAQRIRRRLHQGVPVGWRTER